MQLSDLISISGKPVLFKVIKPGNRGIIVESLDEQKKRIKTTPKDKASILSEIGIYTTISADNSIPLEEILHKIHAQFGGKLELDKKSKPEVLKEFMKSVLPEYDENRVYISDIQKIVSWYKQIYKFAPKILTLPVKKKDKKPEVKKDVKDKADNEQQKNK